MVGSSFNVLFKNITFGFLSMELMLWPMWIETVHIFKNWCQWNTLWILQTNGAYQNCFYCRNSFQGSIYQGVKSISRTSSAKYLLKYLLHVVKVCTLYVKLDCIPNVSPAVLCMIHHVRKLQQHTATCIYPKYYKSVLVLALFFFKPSKVAYFSSKIAEIVIISLMAQSFQRKQKYNI